MRVAAVLLWCVLAALPASRLPELGFDNDTWLPAENPHRVELEYFRKEFEPNEALLVAIKLKRNFFEAEQTNHIQQLEDALVALPKVRSVLSPLSATTIIDTGETLEIGSFSNALEKRYLADANAYRDQFTNSPYADKLLSSDQRTVLLRVAIAREDAVHRSEAVVAVAETVRAHGYPAAHLGGETALKDALNRATRNDLLLLIGAAVLLLAIFLYLICGDWRRALLIFSAAIAAIASCLGMMAHFAWPMSVVLLMLPVMISVIAVADGLHILANWDSFDRMPPHARLIATIKNSWLPCLGATVTSAVGFGAFAISELIPLHHFGMASLLTILYAYPLITGALWGGLWLFPQLAHTPRQRFNWNKWVRLIEYIVTKKSGYVVTLAIAIALMLGSGLTMIRTETNFLSVFFDKQHAVHKAFDLVDDELGGSGRVEVITRNKEGHYDSLHGMREIETLTQQAGEISTINHTESYLLPINMADKAFGGDGLPQSDEALSQELLFLSLSRTETDRSVLEPYLDFDYSSARTSLQTPNLDSAQLSKTLGAVHGIAQRNHSDTTVTGFGVFIHNLSEYVLQTQATSILITLLLIGALLLIQFGIRVGGCALLANMLPLVATTGIVTWLGYPYDFATILIAGVTLGLSVDDTFHFLHHYLRGQQDKSKQLAHALNRTMRPIVTTTLLFCCAFAVITLSDLIVLQRFAVFTAFGLMMAWISVLIFLPALMVIIDAYFKNDTGSFKPT